MNKDLKSRHRAMMRALVIDGLNQRQVSEEFGITEGRLSIIVNSPLWKVEETAMRKECFGEQRKRLERMIPKAIDTLDRVMDDEDNKVALRAAAETLDRSGMVKSVVIESEDPNTPEALHASYKDILQQKVDILDELGITGEEFYKNIDIDETASEIADGGEKNEETD